MERKGLPEIVTDTRDDGPTDVEVLMAEFRQDPQAYMEKRAQLLRGDRLYEQAREQVLAEQKEAVRAYGRRALQLVLHPFSHGRENDNTSAT
ncbi:hypothetical protein ACFO3J_16500 [Streptomyces polygonati]|uniref:Uncharacterized protein n=1 Tax=Streptomyces polygonati TaxID=1617087 RepID=A0ABV8HM25_9ACTN